LVNQTVSFVEQDLLIYTLLGIGVFAFFNFRNKAKCFAGDVGSVAIAYILLFALGALMLATGEFLYILFLSVYGIDAVWTIVRRLVRRENIFQAHRSHLYQFLGNEAKVNKLLVSFLYGAVQFLIGLLVIQFVEEDLVTKLFFAISLLTGMSILYFIGKTYVIRRYVN